MKEKIINLIKCVFLFMLFLTISAIPVLIFRIDINKFNDLDKVIYSLSCSLLFLSIIMLCYKKTLIKDFKPYFKNFGKNFEYSFKYYLIGVGIMIISNLIITLLFQGDLSTNETLVRSYINASPFLMAIDISFYAPLAEELLFRKTIRDVIKNKWLYIFISGFIFGGIHVLGTEGLLGLLYLIPYCSLGFTFAYIYTKTDNIYSSIMLHFMHNTISLILLLFGASL